MTCIESVQNAAACLEFGLILWPCYANSTQRSLAISSVEIYLQDHCPCVQMCPQSSSGIFLHPSGKWHPWFTVCLIWIHLATISTDVNMTEKFCFFWVTSMEQLASSHALQHSVSEHFETETENAFFGQKQTSAVILVPRSKRQNVFTFLKLFLFSQTSAWLLVEMSAVMTVKR